ncbi:MAG: hypothetical protein E7509_05070 [Ruminococcus sp.]|nr:hypothetical protein [Ruminococcus sp.]
MDKKKKLKIALYIAIPVIIIAVVLAIILIDLHSNKNDIYVPDDGKPFYMIEGELADVDRIEISDGESGTTSVIDQNNGLDKVVANFKSVKIQRGEMISKKFGNFYEATIYYKNGEKTYFTIENAESINRQGYAYDILEGKIDYSLLTEYVDTAKSEKNANE